MTRHLRPTKLCPCIAGCRGLPDFRATSCVVLDPFVGVGTTLVEAVAAGIDTDRYLSEIAALHGLETVAIHVPRATRIGSSIIRSDVRVAKAGQSQRLYEAVVELRRPVV